MLYIVVFVGIFQIGPNILSGRKPPTNFPDLHHFQRKKSRGIFRTESLSHGGSSSINIGSDALNCGLISVGNPNCIAFGERSAARAFNDPNARVYAVNRTDRSINPRSIDGTCILSINSLRVFTVSLY